MDRHLAWDTAGRLSVVVHGRKQPTGLEWEEYVNYARGNAGIGDLRLLVWTHGGSPDANQRKTLEYMARQHFPEAPPLAMITGSLVVRAVMSLATVFNPRIKCFSPDQISVAYAYLGLDASERKLAAEMLARLEKAVLL